MSEKNKTMNANNSNIYDDLVVEHKKTPEMVWKTAYMENDGLLYEPEDYVWLADPHIPEINKPKSPKSSNIFYDLVKTSRKRTIPADAGISEPVLSANSFISNNVKYTFDEFKYINEALDHINSTYSEHYSKGKYQATDLIIDTGHGTGFNVGNIQKYAMRYGKKEGYNRKDLLKIIHYAIIQLYVHDKENLSKD